MSPSLAILTAAAVLTASASSTNAEPSAFDGDWNVTLACPESPSGHALAFSFQFPATVASGLLHGQRGPDHQPGWMQLDGAIGPDGSASLIAEGYTNLPAYAQKNVQTGTHYRYAVHAHFEREAGSGSWIAIRTCTFDFKKR